MIISFFAFLAIVSFYLFNNKVYVKTQEEYFLKVKYDIYGKMLSYRLLGGSVYLIEIKVDSINMIKNQLKENDDIVGLYSSKEAKAYILAYFEDGNDETYEKISDSSLPYVKIHSSQKSIEYCNDTNCAIESLRSFNNYKSDLLEYETIETIKF